MTKHEVDEHFGKPPEYECFYQSHRISYYQRPVLIFSHTRQLRDDLPANDAITSIGDIPYIYEAAQLLFDPADFLIAYTINGETTVIVTGSGCIGGDRIDRMPAEFFRLVQ